MSATSASDWSTKSRKEVVCPSGNVAVIRKLSQRDYMPKGLIGLGLGKGSENLDDETLRQYLAENLDDVLSVEDMVLMRGVVTPAITLDGANETLAIADVEPADRGFLLEAIEKWSGLTEDQIGAVNLFRKKVGVGSGTDG